MFGFFVYQLRGCMHPCVRFDITVNSTVCCVQWTWSDDIILKSLVQSYLCSGTLCVNWYHNDSKSSFRFDCVCCFEYSVVISATNSVYMVGNFSTLAGRIWRVSINLTHVPAFSILIDECPLLHHGLTLACKHIVIAYLKQHWNCPCIWVNAGVNANSRRGALKVNRFSMSYHFNCGGFDGDSYNGSIAPSGVCLLQHLLTQCTSSANRILHTSLLDTTSLPVLSMGQYTGNDTWCWLQRLQVWHLDNPELSCEQYNPLSPKESMSLLGTIKLWSGTILASRSLHVGFANGVQVSWVMAFVLPHL